MTLQCEVLPNRSEVRQERLRAFGTTKTTHAALAFMRRCVAVFSTVVNPGSGFDEDVLDVDQFRTLCLCRRIAAVGQSRSCAVPRDNHALKNRLAAALYRRFCNWNRIRHRAD